LPEPEPLYIAKPPKKWSEMSEEERDAWADAIIDALRRDQ
jgi:hypothetical protein